MGGVRGVVWEGQGHGSVKWEGEGVVWERVDRIV